MEITGKNLKDLNKEAGGHRIQRVPPTEKRGRVHTSTVTVSVTNETVKIDEKYNKRSKDDFRIEWFSGQGAGGQHRNKSSNCCRIIHIPTGLKQEKQGRKREHNKREAERSLIEILDKIAKGEMFEKLGKIKKAQVGSGMRGDKKRTYRFQDDNVTDHQTNKKAKCSKIMKGHFDLLW